MGFDSREHLINLRRGKSVMPKRIAELIDRSGNNKMDDAMENAIERGYIVIGIDEAGHFKDYTDSE